LRYADAKDTANLVTQLFSQQNSNQASPGGFGPGGNFPGGPGGGFPGMPPMMGQNAAGTRSGGRDNIAPRVVAVADDRSNSVVISAPANVLPTLDDILDKLDQQASDLTELRIFKLRHADPTELVDQLGQLFPDPSSTDGQNFNPPFFFPGGGGNSSTATAASDRMKKMGKVLAVPDPRTASIIVTAAKTLMPQIAGMVEALDAQQGKREVVSYFELHNADAQDIYQNLQDLFNRSTVRMDNNNNQNSFLGRNNPLTQRATQNQQATTSETISTGLGNSSGTPGARSGP
jgi:type II secretory pathway component GspD/PulD (secretin)